MSILKLVVDEDTRQLIDRNNVPAFVVNDANVNKVRFVVPSGFTDIILDEDTAFRVMYILPGVDRTVLTKTLAFYEKDSESVQYDWDINPSVFASSGVLTIALCILRCGDSLQEWHTIPYQIYVHNSIHTDDSDAGDETITPTIAERVAILESMIQKGRGTGIFKVRTEPSVYTTPIGTYNPSYRISLAIAEGQSGLSEFYRGDILEYEYYHYPVIYVDDEYLYLGQRQSIRGESGATGASGKDAILLRIDSTRGTVFKNNRVETVLNVTIFYGSSKIENITDLKNAFGSSAHLEWQWLRLNEETYGTIASTDSRLLRDGFSFVLSPEDVDVKVTFRCNLVV